MAASILSPPSLYSINRGIREVCLHVRLKKLFFKQNCLNLKGAIVSCSTTTSSLHLDETNNGPSSAPRSVQLFNQSSRSPYDIAEFQGQLEELFDEVKSMISIGKVEDAKNLLEANYAYVREQKDDKPKGIEQAAILDILALGYMALGDFKMVKSLLDMLDDAVHGLRDNEPLLDSVLTHMGSMYSAVRQSEKSILAYKRSIGILENEYGSNSIFIVTPLLGMAKVLGSIGRATKAVEAYERVISILEMLKGGESEDLVVPLLGLGNLVMKEKRAAAAESTFTRIVNIYKKLYGENDERAGMALCSLAHVKCAKGNIDEAIDLYRKAIQILKNSQNMNLDDEIMEKMKIDLAELLHSVGRGKEGRELLEECLLITEKCKGKEHPSLVPNLVNLATSYSHSRNFVEAERLLRTSLQIMEKSTKPDDPSISFPMLNLAVTLHFLEKHEEAEQLAFEALRLRELAFGKESLPVGEALDCLLSIQSKLGKGEKGLLELSNRVLSIQEKAFGYESKEVMQTLKNIVFFLDKMGMKSEIFPLQKRLSVLRNKYKNMVRY